MIMRDRVPCRVPVLGLALIGLLALVAVPGWSLSQQPADIKAEVKKVEKKTGEKGEVPVLYDVLVTAEDLVQAGKGGSDSDRLDRLEKQLEALLQEVKAMRSGAGHSAGKEVKVEVVKPGAKAGVNKEATSVYQIDPKIAHQQAQKGAADKNFEYSVIFQNEQEHGGTVTLTRATYKMPKEKAEALAKFLGDQVKGQVLETKVEGEGIVVTTTPHIQRTIHDFINLVQGGGKTFSYELKGGDFKIETAPAGK